MKAPNFSLADQNNIIHTLTEYAGNPLVVYFYPKDDTPGCTKEACGFRDIAQELEKYGAKIVGISKDSVVSHKKFADKYHLTFPLLSDPTAKTIQAFGAWGEKKFMGRTYQGIKRNTYIVDKDGQIVKTFEGVNPLTHAGDILSFFAG